MATAKSKPSYQHGYLKLGSLVGVHQRLQSLIESLGYIGGGVFPIRSDLTRDSIIPLLELTPILVAPRNKGNYLVIGGLRQFVMAKHLLTPEDEINVLVNHGRVNHDKMLMRFAVEYALLPLLMGNLEEDEVVCRFTEVKKILPEAIKGDREELARFLGVSMRTLASLYEKNNV